jgi:2-C-methyl-D-erythritol 4-phosphate cytidylyltransferase
MTPRIMIVVGAGRSLRYGEDKLMTIVAGLPLIGHTVAAVRGHVDRTILVCREDQIPALTALDLGADLVIGGPSRTASEMAGIDAIDGPAELIGIHDGARPLVRGELIETLFEVARARGGAIPVTSPTMPLVRRDDLTPARRTVFAQTPQVFRGEALVAAYRSAREAGFEGHDTAAVAERFGDFGIEGVPGDPGNIKVTTPADMEVVSAALDVFRSEPR